MKYPYTSMVIGQLIMNQPIEIELWNNFQDEYYHYVREKPESEREKMDYLTPFGTDNFYYYLQELHGSLASINRNRERMLGDLTDVLVNLFGRFEGSIFPLLDAKYPLDRNIYLPEYLHNLRDIEKYINQINNEGNL
jgi:hypothetical protein